MSIQGTQTKNNANLAKEDILKVAYSKIATLVEKFNIDLSKLDEPKRSKVIETIVNFYLDFISDFKSKYPDKKVDEKEVINYADQAFFKWFASQN
jgi:hypothetical protein